MTPPGLQGHVRIGKDLVGARHPPLFWPDIDVYFRRDEQQGIALVDQVAASGARYLKSAVLHRHDLCLPGARRVTYLDRTSGREVSERYEAVIARHVVPLDMLARLTRRARDAGLGLILSVYDREGLDFALGEGALAVKIPSSNITHRALIEVSASAPMPLVIDTGRSRFDEIVRAVGWAREAGAASRLVLQHSPPGPPAPASRFHMRMLAHLQACFGCPVGLSDHHPDLAMFPIAIALGAAVLEKGLVADGAGSDIDIAHALPVSRLAEALRLIETSWQSLGETYRPDSEVAPDPVDRMGLIARRDLLPGQRLEADAIGFAFPVVGIGAEAIAQVVGAGVATAIALGEPITWDALEPLREAG
jgi:sialic acid synthase SpsE